MTILFGKLILNYGLALMMLLITFSITESIGAAAGGLDSEFLKMVEKTSSSESVQPDRKFYDVTATSGPLSPTPYSVVFPNFGNGKVIYVAKDVSAQFRSVQSAVNSIPQSNSRRIVIRIKPGIYKEKVRVKQSWITFQGDGAGRTVIEWDDNAARTGSTFTTATLTVEGDHFTAKDISFKNTSPAPLDRSTNGQAVALHISGDYGAFFNVNIHGNQDTLYDHQGRHYFYNCYIEGIVDFIFGNGRSFYFKTRLHSIAKRLGSTTAQKRESVGENTGFSFVGCSITGSGFVYLGRAWGSASRVVYSRSYFSKNVVPKGWYDWGNAKRQLTVFYAEYKCKGPGANTRGRVWWSKVLNDKQAKPFLHTGFINGEKWLKSV